MRMLMIVKVDTTKGNHALTDGSFATIMQSTLEKIHPESAVFTVFEGVRTAFIVFDLISLTLMPSIGEPLFMGLKAKIDLYPAMNAEDLQTGLQTLLGGQA